MHGRSLGGAVAIYSASQLLEFKFDLKGIIVENTFLSISEMVEVIFPKLKFFSKIILKNFWPSKNRIDSIKSPMLFVISWKDEIVPKFHMEELYKRAKNARFKERVI